MIKLLLSVFVVFFTFPVLAQESAIMVKYVSPEFVYITAGRMEGITEKAQLKVMKNGKQAALIEAVYTASHSSSCKVLSQTSPVKAGYKVILLTTKKTRQAQKETSLISRKRRFKTRTSPPKESGARISGYMALQEYYFKDKSASKYDQSLPSLRLKINAQNIFSRHLNFRLRFRSRYNAQGRSLPSLRQQNRLYEASLSYDNPTAPFYAKMGRIISSGFSGIGYMDGILLGQRISEKWKWGIFGGTQPQWQYSTFQTSYQKYGAFLSFQQGRYGSNRMEISLSAAGVYHNHTISREFLYQRFSYHFQKKWNLYQSLEIDINRGWRRDRSIETASISGLYLSGRYKATSWLTAGLSYDNRKNYYTYEIRSLADSLFDDAQRQGLRSNVTIRFLQDYRLNAYFGIRKKSYENGVTYSYGSTVSKQHFLIKRMFLSGRISGFDNYFISGQYPSARIGYRFKKGHSLYIRYGAYSYTLKTNRSNYLSQWLRINGQFMLPLNFYMNGYYEYDWGDHVLGHRIFTEFGYYF